MNDRRHIYSPRTITVQHFAITVRLKALRRHSVNTLVPYATYVVHTGIELAIARSATLRGRITLNTCSSAIAKTTAHSTHKIHSTFRVACAAVYTAILRTFIVVGGGRFGVIRNRYHTPNAIALQGHAVCRALLSGRERIPCAPIVCLAIARSSIAYKAPAVGVGSTLGIGVAPLAFARTIAHEPRATRSVQGLVGIGRYTIATHVSGTQVAIIWGVRVILHGDGRTGRITGHRAAVARRLNTGIIDGCVR